MSSVKKLLKNPAKIVFLFDKLKINWLLPSKTYLKLKYKACMGKKLNLNNPQTFNEKLQWLKLYDKKPIYTTMVDKYEAKKYVAERIGEEYIIPTLGVWDKFDDIDFDALPNQFVLKCTHDSGGLVIVKDKSKFNKEQAKKKIEKSLKTNYYLLGREWPYKKVKRRIIAEKYMDDGNDGLTDYKFFCFNGNIKFLYISRGLENHATAEISFFDLEGKEEYFSRSDYKRLKNFEVPNNWTELKKIAQLLAENANSSFIRVDLYLINEHVYFSELTFYPCSGFLPFEPECADFDIGKMIKLTM